MTGRIRTLEDFREYLLEGFRRNLRAKGIPEDELEATLYTSQLVECYELVQQVLPG